MGVVRDITVEQLAQAVGGIDTTGLVKDSTLQATNTELSNIDTTGQSIASAISGLGATLGSDKANISGDNIADKSTFRQNIGLDSILIAKKVQASTTIQPNTVSADIFDLPNPSSTVERCVLNYYNSSRGLFGFLTKYSNGNIVVSELINANNNIYITGIIL